MLGKRRERVAEGGEGVTRRDWERQAREQLEQVRGWIDSLDLELESQGPEWRAAGDLEAVQVREDARDALETEAAWWESFAPLGEQW